MPASSKFKTSTLSYPVDGDSIKCELNADDILAFAVQYGMKKMPTIEPCYGCIWARTTTLDEFPFKHFCQDMPELYSNTKRDQFISSLDPLIVLKKCANIATNLPWCVSYVHAVMNDNEWLSEICDLLT